MRDVSESDLESLLTSEKPKLVMFHTRWCGFCRLFSDTFDEVSKTSSDIDFLRVDLSELDRRRWDSYRISVVPTLIGFKNSKIVTRRDGKLARGLNRKDLHEVMNELAQAEKS